MKKKARYLALGVLVLTVVLPRAYGANVKDFHTSWDAARQAAKAVGKPVYLHFTTTWCSWCRRIETETYTSKAGSAALAEFVPATLDCTDAESAPGRENRELLKRFGGTGFPYLVMVTPEGVVLNTINGYVPPEQFAADLTKAKKLYDQWTEFQAWAAKADKTSYEYHRRAMAIHTKFDSPAEAAVAARQVRKLDPDDKRGDAAEAALALLREAYSKPRSAQRAEQVAALATEIRRRDPDNAKGVLQHAMAIEVVELLEKVAATQDVEVRRGLLDEAAVQITELQRVGKLSGRVQILWAYLGQFNAAAGRVAEARAAYQKAIDAAPKGELVPRIRQLMERGEHGR